MENEELERSAEQFEPKPGFDLVKYGSVFTFNFNQEFAQRLKNILADFHKNHGLQGQVLCFFKTIRKLMDLPDEETGTATQFMLERFQHVFTVVCERDFAQSLNQVLTHFLVQKRVSPALFSFAKQLEGALYPKRFDSKTRYADEF
jgi:hypothetical protein